MIPEPARAAYWPLAGTPEFDRKDGEWRARMLGWSQQTLERHVVRPWFPRSFDDRGGFHSELGHRWQRLPEGRRLLEYQARQTRTVARLALAGFDTSVLRPRALAALRYVRSAFWDREHGGMFTMIKPDGGPLLGASKHAHGAAYAMGAAAEVFRLTEEQEALDVALEIFGWLDEHLYDRENGGYHGWATRAGRPILTAADTPPEVSFRDRDHLGHGVGLKDANVHTDLLDALSVLVEVSGDVAVRRRVDELYDIVATRFATSVGAVHYLTDVALVPIPGLEQFGYPAQVGYRLCRAAAVTGRPMRAALDQARTIADHMLERALDSASHGIFEAGASVEPTGLSGHDLTVRTHPWWVQTETAQLLLTVSLEWPDELRYSSAFERLLGFLDRQLIDFRYGGLLRLPKGDRGRRQRLSAPDQKADQWKDASHEADMCLHSIRMLRGTAADAPLLAAVAA